LALSASYSSAGGTVSLNSLAISAEKWWPARPWSRVGLHGVLHNPAYVGDVVVRPTGAAEPIVVRDAHTAIISRALFEAVQVRLAANQKERSNTAGGHPLTGLVVCAAAGRGPPDA
jgi:hypothetical protein